MKKLFTAAVALALAASATAQMGGKYGRMKIDHAGEIIGNFKGAIERMSGGVKLELISDDPAQGNLPIAADTITFEWVDGSTQPKQIVLTGNVRIRHPEADVTSEKAVWDFSTGKLTFSGNPVMDSPKAQNMRGGTMTLNMNDGTFQVTNVKIDSIDLGSAGGGMSLGGSGGGGGGAALSDGDITDWAGLVNELKAGGGNAGTPAGHIVGMLGQKERGMLMDTPTDVVVANKGALLKQLNALLATKQFYNAAAWQGVNLPQETAAKLAAGDTPDAERAALNAAAFKAAFAKYTR
jgi:hypothetical protein